MEIAQLLPPQDLDDDPVLEFEAELEQAAHELDIEPWLLARLKHAEREITVNLPIAGKDRNSIHVAGYRIQHCRAAGPMIGPVILSPTAHPAGLRLSAAAITLQSALMGLRLGGAAGALVCDSARHDEHELSQMVASYVDALRDVTGPLQDVLASVGPEWLARSLQTFATRVHGHTERASVVGSAVRSEAAASAIVALVQRALHRDDLSQLRVAVQGFGRVGRSLIEALDGKGAKVIAIADRSGAVIRQDGLDVKRLGAFVAQSGVVFGYPDADAASNADALESDCDLLVLAAAPHQIGAHNVRRIRARAILELTEQGVSVPAGGLPAGCLLIPSLVSGCAQLAVWSYEWQKGLDLDEADTRHAADYARAKVVTAFDLVREAAQENALARGVFRVALQQLQKRLIQ